LIRKEGNVVYSVLLPLISTRSPGDVFKLLLGPPANFPLSTSLLTNYAKELDLKLLRDFYFVDDRRWEMALLELKEGLDLSEKAGDAFGERVEKVRRAGKKFGEDKEFGFEAKVSTLSRFLKLILSGDADARGCVGALADYGRTCQTLDLATNSRK